MTALSVHEVDDVDVEDLWHLYATQLVRYATLLAGPTDAPDLVSTAFEKLVHHPLRLENPRGYLFKVVTNAAISQGRSDQRRQLRDLHAVSRESFEPDPRPDVVQAVANLRVTERAVVYFTYWEDLDANSIAAILGMTSGNVRRILTRAHQRLQKVFK